MKLKEKKKGTTSMWIAVCKQFQFHNMVYFQVKQDIPKKKRKERKKKASERIDWIFKVDIPYQNGARPIIIIMNA